MKLTNVSVFDFKSIRSSNDFSLTDITCLVGKNEAGKTAILEALYRLNPVIADDGKYDVTEDFPRSDVEDYRQAVEAKTRKPATVVRATFALEPDELVQIHSRFGNDVLVHPQIILTKGYANTLRYVIEVNEASALSAMVQKAELQPAVADEATKQPTVEALLGFLTAKSQQQEKEFAAATAAANALPDQQEKTKALEAAKGVAETAGSKTLRALLTEIKAVGLGQYVWDKFLKQNVPKFLYFDEYYQMEGAVNLEALKGRLASPLPADRPMLGLIDAARLDIDTLIAPKKTQDLRNRLNGGSVHISKKILPYWSQNKHIRLQFDVRPALPEDPPGMTAGHNLWGSVYDEVHQAEVGIGRRSRGFIWFFSFVAWYSLQKKQNDKLILLLDEPGLFLHGKAQGDFLRYIETELKPNHQVVYTTHSPFLVDARHFDRVRIVEDKSMDTDEELPEEKRGTKVSSDVLTVSKGSLFPLQGALGYELAQTLFIGPNSLIVEGVSDLLYIQGMSSLLDEQGRAGLRPAWIVTPVGGSDKISTFAALIGVQSGMNVAALIDFQKKDQQQIENLHRKLLLEQNHVLTYAQFTGTRP